MNILEDMYEERGRLDDTQRALLNILDDVETERNLAEQSKTLLESVNKELEAFSYSVSHDLRAPLRAVSGFAEAVLEDYSPLLDDGGVKYLGLIAENAKKMSRLIDDLLAFSRIGRREIVKTGINLREIAVQTFNELISQEPGRHVVFNAHHVPEAYGDISMIRQVLVNLLSNAIKFTRPVKAGVIEFGWQRGAYHIRDNGVGFDIEYAGKLFGVFQRLHSEAEFEGTGVGLALAHRIVTRHGGEVWTKSRIGEGATFFFTLPAKGKVGSHWRNRKF
ncbi:MAG: two-component sensor histidine kinase [Armatimonadetes bacterium]|nr:two-component sensor histidine kinase [Armatimonadota bacterium]